MSPKQQQPLATLTFPQTWNCFKKMKGMMLLKFELK